jgi:hypothetical protein
VCGDTIRCFGKHVNKAYYRRDDTIDRRIDGIFQAMGMMVAAQRIAYQPPLRTAKTVKV